VRATRTAPTTRRRPAASMPAAVLAVALRVAPDGSAGLAGAALVRKRAPSDRASQRTGRRRRRLPLGCEYREPNAGVGRRPTPADGERSGTR
jgi:hypothetical protein